MANDAAARGFIPDGLEHFEWSYVRCGDLNVDIYQRLVELKRAKQIADEFDWCKFRPLDVGMRPDGTFWIKDGQHRWKAVRDKFGEDALIPCWVKLDSTREEEAYAFLGINNGQKTVKPGAAVNAGEHAGDLAAVAVLEALRDWGADWDFNSVGVKKADGVFSCWGTLIAIYRDGGKEAVSQTIGLLENMWCWSKDSLTAYSVLGTWKFIKKWGSHPSFRLPQVPAKISRGGWEMVKRLSAEASANSGKTLDRAEAWCIALENAYNFGQKGDGRLS